MIKKLFILFILLSGLTFSCAFAATYYISPVGSDSAGGTSAVPWATFSHAFSAMSGGDTLIVRDGTYNQIMRNPPSGSAVAYTIIKAENDGEAILQNTTAQYMLYFQSVSYVRVEGLKFVSNAVDGVADVAVIDNGSNHNKIMRCAFVKTPSKTQDNVSNVVCDGTYNLFEECWAWGGGRYKFLVYGGDDTRHGSYNIFRRCVVRHDREYSGGFNPQAAFCNYQGANNIFQNCIVINSNFPPDNDYGASWTAQPYYDSWVGPWFLEKGQKGGFVKLSGCIALGFSGTFVSDDSNGSDSDTMYRAGNLIFTNTVAIDGYNGIPIIYAHSGRTVTVDHCIIGALTGQAYWSADYLGWGFTGGPSTASNAVATNSIFYNLKASGGGGILRVGGANDYNCFYGNTVDRSSSTTGAHDITAVNPLSASLKYPVRIEAGSSLKGAGSGSSDIGPILPRR